MMFFAKSRKPRIGKIKRRQSLVRKKIEDANEETRAL